MEFIKILSEFGQAGAILVVILVFLKHIRDSDSSRDRQEELGRASIESLHEKTNAALHENTQIIAKHIEVQRQVIDALKG